LLESGTVISVLYHTPQLLRGTIDPINGSFMLRKEGEQIVTDNLDSIKRYVDLQALIARVRHG
jgi:hypothetical protein